MSIIKGSDLVDFDDFERQLNKLESRFLAYGKGSIETIDKLKAAQNEYIETLRRLEAAIKSVNVKGSGAGSTLAVNAKDVDRAISSIERYKATIESMQDVSRLNELSISQLKAGIGALKTQYDNLDPTAKEFKDSQAQIANQVKLATQAVNAQSAVMKTAVKAVNDVNNTYNKLSKETGELKAQLRALPGAFDVATGAINKNNAAGVALQKQIKINDSALKRMDAAMGNYQRNVGNYSSAFSGLGSTLSGIIGPALGIATAFEAVQKSLQVIDQMTRIRLSLEAVSDSTTQLGLRLNFLRGIADQTGVDVNKLAATYVNFTASARNTSVEGAAADKIFSSFTKTFSALGRSSEVAERGLYALQQMLSKGKVSSEELNQQLAEALPGANKLFADALGVSTARLADMLKKGDVLAVDVLPKVAAQLEKTYGDRAQRNIETMSGSWTRITNQVGIFLEKLDKKAGITEFFASLNNGLADTIKGLNRAIERKGIFNALFTGGGGSLVKEANDQRILDEFKDEDLPKRIARIRIEQEALAKSQEKLSLMDKKVDGYEYSRTNRDIERQKELVKDLIKLNGQLRRAERGENEKLNSNAANNTDTGEDPKTKKQLTQYEKLIKAAEKLRGVVVDDILADAKAGRPLEVSDEALAKWNKLYDVIRQVANATGDQIPANLRELNDKLTKAPQDIANQIPIETISAADSSTSGKAPQMDSVVDLTKYNALLGVHEKEIENLQNRLINGSFKKFSDEYAVQLESQLKEIQSLEKDAALAQTDQERQAVNERIALAKQEYDEKVRLAREEIAIKRELQEQLVNLAMESVGAVFQIGSDQRDADLDSLQASLDHELSLVQGNEEAQARIKKDYAKKELEIRQKQAKAEKAQAIFSIAINTIKAIAAANAVGPPANIAFMAIAAAIGAIQLATAIAKPIPQFYKGTKSAPEGYAQVAEKGAEIRESDGKMMIYDKPGVAYLKKGDKIYTAQETKAMLERSESNGKINTILSRTSAGQNTRGEILSSQAAITALSVSSGINYNKLSDILFKAVEGKPVLQTIIDENGMRKRHIGKNGTTTYLDKRYSLNK